MARLLTPCYIGTRWPSRFGNQLVLWYKPALGGRRKVGLRDCPECADGKIEVGSDSYVAECLRLGEYLLRKERGARAAEQLAVRFTDEVIAHLPRTVPWSIDACTIKDWVDDVGVVHARWDRAEHLLPPAATDQPALTTAPTPPLPPPVLVPTAAAKAMDDALTGIAGDDF